MEGFGDGLDSIGVADVVEVKWEMNRAELARSIDPAML